MDESLAETRHNGQTQTKVCSQTKGVQSVDVISEERILGKFSPQGCRRPSVGSETLLVAKTWPPLGNTPKPLGNTPKEYALWGGGGDC